MQEFVHLREGDEVAETVQQLLRELRDNDEIADKVAVKWGAQTWTWREHLDEAARQAAALIGIADPDRPLHVGVLLGNTPDMLTAMMFQIIEGVEQALIRRCRHDNGSPGKPRASRSDSNFSVCVVWSQYGVLVTEANSVVPL